MPLSRAYVVRAAIAAIAALPLALLAACGSAAEPGATATVTETASASVSASPSATPSASTSPSPATPAAPAQCRTADLKAAIGDPEGAAGSSYSTITITNTGTSPCTTGGFGGVSYVGGEAGVQIGAAATRDMTVPEKTLVLAPGQSAKAQLQEGTSQNYDKAMCMPAKAQGLKIIPPNETEPLFVRHPTTACQSTSVNLLQIQAYQAA